MADRHHMALIENDTLANHGGGGSDAVGGEAFGFDDRGGFVFGRVRDVGFLELGEREHVRKGVAVDGGGGPGDELGVAVFADYGCVDGALGDLGVLVYVQTSVSQ